MEFNYQNLQSEVRVPNLRIEVVHKSDIATTYNYTIDIKKISELAEKILSSNKLARNSDVYLVLKGWQYANRAKVITYEEKQGFFIPFENMFGMTSPESLPRARRKLNEQGKYLADDPEVIYKRRQYEKSYKEYYSKQC